MASRIGSWFSRLAGLFARQADPAPRVYQYDAPDGPDYRPLLAGKQSKHWHARRLRQQAKRKKARQ